MSYYNLHFVNVINNDTYYRTVQQTETLASSKESWRDTCICFYRVMVPIKNIDVVILEAYNLNYERVSSVSLFTNNGCYELEKFDIVSIDNAIKSDFSDIDWSHYAHFCATVDKDVLRCICEANSLSIRVVKQTGSIDSFDDKKKYELNPSMNVPSKVTPLTYFRAVYNAFFDENAWPECKEKVKHSFIQRLCG